GAHSSVSAARRGAVAGRTRSAPAAGTRHRRSGGRRVKIAILFDGASALAKSPDMLILHTVEAIESALTCEGNQLVRVPVHPDGRWVERIRRGHFDLAFNMCEGIDGVADLEPPVISVLELFGVPYTGCSSYTASICLRKHVVNAMLERAGLPIPRYNLV